MKDRGFNNEEHKTEKIGKLDTSLYESIDYTPTSSLITDSIEETKKEFDQKIIELKNDENNKINELEQKIDRDNNKTLEYLNNIKYEQTKFNDMLLGRVIEYYELYNLFIRIITSRFVLFLNSIFNWFAFQPEFNEFATGVSRDFVIKIYIKNKNGINYYHLPRGIKELNKALKQIIPVYAEYIEYKKDNKYFKHMSVYTFIHMCTKYQIQTDNYTI